MTNSNNGAGQVTGSGQLPEARNWGVVLLAHGSQRGSERSECSCAWSDSGSSPPQWCLDCPNASMGLRTCGGSAAGTTRSSQSPVGFIVPRVYRALSRQGSQDIRRSGL